MAWLLVVDGFILLVFAAISAFSVFKVTNVQHMPVVGWLAKNGKVTRAKLAALGVALVTGSLGIVSVNLGILYLVDQV